MSDACDDDVPPHRRIGEDAFLHVRHQVAWLNGDKWCVHLDPGTKTPIMDAASWMYTATGEALIHCDDARRMLRDLSPETLRQLVPVVSGAIGSNHYYLQRDVEHLAL